MKDHLTLLGVIAGGMISLLLVVIVGLNTLHWMGVPFPGFLVMANRVVPSISLPHWGTDSARLFQHQVVAVDSEPVVSAQEIYERVRHRPAGSSFEYTLRAADGSLSILAAASRGFSAYDYLLLFGVYLFNAIVFLAAGFGIFWSCRGSAASLGFLSACISLGAFALTGADLYGPHWFFRLHVLAETMMAAGVVHLALVFPVDRLGDHRYPTLVAIYLAFAVVAIVYECVLYWPSAYTAVHLTASAGHGIAGIAFLVSVVHARFGSADRLARWRVGVVGAGAVAAFIGPTLLMGGSALFGGDLPVNAAGFTAFVFPISVAYAISRHELLAMDTFRNLGLAGSGDTAEAEHMSALPRFLRPVNAWVARLDAATGGKLPRGGALAGGVAASLLVGVILVNSASWIGRSFPGFLVMENRVVASVSLPDWRGNPAAVFQHQVLAVDGGTVGSAADVYERVRSKPVGSAFEYTMRAPNGELRTESIRSQRFSEADYASLFGPFFLTGAAFIGVGLLVLLLQPRQPSTAGLLSIGVAGGVFVVTAVDLYSPHWFFRLHLVAEALVPAALVHLALVFPANRLTHRTRPVLAGIYAACLALAVVSQLVWSLPTAYTTTHLVASTAQGIGGLTLVWIVAYELLTTTSELVRRRIAVAGVGTLLGFLLPAALMGLSGLNDGAIPVNAAAMTGFLFPLALAYAIMKQEPMKMERLLGQAARIPIVVAASSYTTVLAKVLATKSRFL